MENESPALSFWYGDNILDRECFGCYHYSYQKLMNRGTFMLSVMGE